MRCSCTGGILLTCILGLALTSRAQEQKPASQKHRYTIAEYNAYENAVKQAEPEEQVQLLDEFVSKYPASALLALVYSQYSKAYGEMKISARSSNLRPNSSQCAMKSQSRSNTQRTIGWADAYIKMDAADPILAGKAEDIALNGVHLLEILKKPWGDARPGF